MYQIWAQAVPLIHPHITISDLIIHQLMLVMYDIPSIDVLVLRQWKYPKVGHSIIIRLNVASELCKIHQIHSLTCNLGGSYVTLHDKTKHNALTTNFEIRPPLLKPLNYCSCKFEVSSLCSHEDMSQNVPGSPVLKFSSKRNETLLCTLHEEVHILTVH